MWSWGYNYYGQLGTGSTLLFEPTPKVVKSFTTYTAVAAGAHHSVALEQGGMVLAWGWNHVGQLGIGTKLNSGVPTRVRGSGAAGENYYLHNIIGIVAGGYHNLAVGKDGRTSAWGWNHYGQLGTGTTANSLQPVAVPGLEPGALSAGIAHSLALTARGG